MTDRDAMVAALAEALPYCGSDTDEGHRRRAERQLAALEAAGWRLYPDGAGDGLRAAVVVEMENEGVVTWGDERHRARFLALATPASDSLDVERRIAAENSMLLDAHHRADARQRGPMGGGGPVGCPVCGAALDALAPEVTR